MSTGMRCVGRPSPLKAFHRLLGKSVGEAAAAALTLVTKLIQLEMIGSGL